ncbi:hypothetical protein GCM10010168_14160 [Actinoplanes ianthinogenes]|uniref:CBM2 domain-containing protein n=1 Tax=Actinoplanes ianthinogenes TaxID=122358 RepID=A0ABM7LZ79_9ACTN|nr:hypothetical protein Aiant_52600 [Actinoplanes ianthinogenes]GGQ98997.1 hypothetical protein GCM10010168_14160 [Actinoplanes ianthinogenes]
MTNTGSSAHNFTVTIGYSTSVRISGGPWNARAASSSGTQIALASESSLAGGASIRLGFQGETNDRNLKQTGCSVAVVAG